jgi:hypothetical protein
MILYHRTTAASAEQILSSGFRDAIGYYGTGQQHSGVWLSDVPLDISAGAEGDTLFRVKLSEEVVAAHEWIEKEGSSYHEWLVPAQLINEHGCVHVVDKDEER